MKSLRTVGLALTALAIAAPAATAASFNCARARTPDERTVCADRGLNDRDVRMAVMFDIATHLVAMGQRGALQDEQVDWLKSRRQCGANRQCLYAVYDHRIARLNQFLGEVESRGPF